MTTADYIAKQATNADANGIIIHEVLLPGTALPATSGIHHYEKISFDPRASQDVISTQTLHRSTGMPKGYCDTLADSSEPQNASVRWTFAGQTTPVFTHLFLLVRDNMGGSGGGGIVFSRSVDQERNLANRMQHRSRASPDFYRVSMPPQAQYRPTPPRLAYCAACGRRSARSKRHRAVSDHQCRAAAGGGSSTDGWQVMPTRSSSSDAARQVSHRLLEASRRHASEAYMRTGSTNEFHQARELSQRLLTADLRRMQDTWQSPR